MTGVSPDYAFFGGDLGTPVAATAFVASHGYEHFHPRVDFFYRAGGGPMLDVGPYYVTALVHLLGPVARVSGSATRAGDVRTIAREANRPERIAVEVATHVAGTLDFRDGAVASSSPAGSLVPWPAVHRGLRHGGLAEPAGPGHLRRRGARPPAARAGVQDAPPRDVREWPVVPLTHRADVLRGIGAADLADSVRRGRPHRASGELARHVLDVLLAFERSGETGRHAAIETVCERPAPLPPSVVGAPFVQLAPVLKRRDSDANVPDDDGLPRPQLGGRARRRPRARDPLHRGVRRGLIPTTHFDPTALVASDAERAAFLASASDRGLEITALSCHGNPLHPDSEVRETSRAALAASVRLAGALGVPHVNALAGCPGGGPDDRVPNWIIHSTTPELEAAYAWQWEGQVLPYWASVAELARAEGVVVCVEPHSGIDVVYNVATFERLAACGDGAIAMNFDPSHLWWQGIDVLEVVKRCAGAIGTVHVKARAGTRASCVCRASSPTSATTIGTRAAGATHARLRPRRARLGRPRAGAAPQRRRPHPERRAGGPADDAGGHARRVGARARGGDPGAAGAAAGLGLEPRRRGGRRGAMSTREGTTVVVTGAADGIGHATAERFRVEGARVVGLDVRAPAAPLDGVEHRIADVTDHAALAEVFAELPPGRLVCVANAGISRVAPFAETSPEDWRAVIEVNLLGVMNLFHLAARHAIAAGAGGALLATSSVAGLDGEAQIASYAASKSALTGLVKSLAEELGPAGITVNAVAPGQIDTPMNLRDAQAASGAGAGDPRAEYVAARIPLRRLGTAGEVAAVFAWLASATRGT